MKKKTVILILVIAVVAAAASFGVYRLATYRSANHADRVSDSELVEINRVTSGKAIAIGAIRSDEILLLHTLTKTPGQDSVAEFYIYQLPEGANGEDFMGLQPDEIDQDTALVHMGTLTCRLVENDHTISYDLKAAYIR